MNSPGIERLRTCGLIAGLGAAAVACGGNAEVEGAPEDRRRDMPMRTAVRQEVTLPDPQRAGAVSLEEAIARRRSVRDFSDAPLTAAQIGQLAWAAQGITDDAGHRASPSAGALYPLELYVATPEAVFRYDPRRHRLQRHLEGDHRRAIQAAALGQEAIGSAPAVFVIAAVYERTEVKYGPRTARYVHMEAGHAAQNILLQAAALELGSVPMGAFHDDRLAETLALPGDGRPLYLIPVGHPQR